MGKLSSIASLTMCLAMANAFVARLPKVAPAYPGWGGQSASRFRAPLGGDDRRVVGAGGTFSRVGGSDAAEAEKRSQSRMPSTEGHAAVGSRSTVALHVFKGLEPEITEDGNATVPIVGGDGGEEGGDSGLAAAPHDEAAVTQHHTTMSAEEHIAQHHFPGEETSVPDAAPEAQESASTTQKEDDDNAHGAADDAKATTDENLATGTDITADGDITTDVDITTDAGIDTVANLATGNDLELLSQEQLSLEASSDATNDESHGVTGDDAVSDKALSFDLTSDGVASVVSIVLEGAFDDALEEPVSYYIDDADLQEELRYYLAAHGLTGETSSWPSDPEMMTEHTAADEFASVPYDDISDGATANEEVFEEPVNDLVFSVLRDSLSRGTASKDLMLDAPTDDLMRSKLHDAVSGRAVSEAVGLADALDGMITNLLHDAFFGPESSKAVSALAKSADDSQLVVDEYVQAVAELYDKFKKVRGLSPDDGTPVVLKAGKGRGGWIKKLWKRVRRKGR